MFELKRRIKFWWQKRTRGWSDDECWNLDYSFILWINSRLKVYKEQAGKFIYLEYHKFEYCGKTYTKLELIDRVIELSDKYICKANGVWFEDKLDPLRIEIIDIFKLIYWNLWW